MRRRWFAIGAALAASRASAQAPSVSVEAAPLAWRRYASDVEAMLIAVIADDEARGLQDAALTAGLRMRLWIGPDGSFTRIEAAAAPEFAGGLATLLAARRAPIPPGDMTWPMILFLRLDPLDRG